MVYNGPLYRALGVLRQAPKGLELEGQKVEIKRKAAQTKSNKPKGDLLKNSSKRKAGNGSIYPDPKSRRSENIFPK